ncbi:MAG: hypothetical protein JKY17_06295 [Magnetovibrio sp.]|nr:hypothetical protein [Magnetovibrio sp.]
MIKSTQNGASILTPHYDLIDQSSLDAQLTKDATLWKLEAISRTGQGRRIMAAVGGVEHTLYGISGSQMDLGLLSEYQYDNRNTINAPPTSADNDVFVGARLTLNDAQNTTLLAGAIVDRKTKSSTFSLDAERRLNDNLKLTLEARLFANIKTKDALAGIKSDDVLIVRLRSYF